MLENRRYNRALTSNGRQETPSSHIFLDQEYTTQRILRNLGAHDAVLPSEVPHVGTILMCPELIPSLRRPYAVEILGMPHAGKSSALNRYLTELWSTQQRHLVGYVQEGASTIADTHADMRITDPFGYSLLAGTATYLSYLEAISRQANTGMRMIAADRGQIDRRVFRRTLFAQGNVNPEIMEDEDEFMAGLENTPVQIGGIILFMVRPDVSLQRSRPGPVTNLDFLPWLYEQYWRLHGEILEAKIPYRIYTCIDAEKDQEEVYGRFKYAMDSILHVQETFYAALAEAFPEEVDRAKTELGKHPHKRHKSRAAKILGEKLGEKNVLIVGGDEMETEDDILNKPIIEGYRLRK